MSSETNAAWPVVGGEYRWTGDHDPAWRSRVENIDADGMVEYRFMRDGVFHGNMKQTSLRAFRNGHFPEDRGVQKALVAALKAYQSAAESWHNFHDHEPRMVQCDEICACIDAGKAALALAGESEQNPSEESDNG